MTAIRVISVFKFVCVNEAPLVPVLIICLEELARKRALNSLIIGGIAPILSVKMICSSHGRRILTNRITGHQIIVFVSELILVPSARLKIIALLTQLGYE